MLNFQGLLIKTFPILNNIYQIDCKNKKMDLQIKKAFYKIALIKHNKEKIL